MAVGPVKTRSVWVLENCWFLDVFAARKSSTPTPSPRRARTSSGGVRGRARCGGRGGSSQAEELVWKDSCQVQSLFGVSKNGLAVCCCLTMCKPCSIQPTLILVTVHLFFPSLALGCLQSWTREKERARRAKARTRVCPSLRSSVRVGENPNIKLTEQVFVISSNVYPNFQVFETLLFI